MIIIRVVVILSQIRFLVTNSNPEYFFQVDTETDCDVDPSSFVTARLCESDRHMYSMVNCHGTVLYIGNSLVFGFPRRGSEVLVRGRVTTACRDTL